MKIKKLIAYEVNDEIIAFHCDIQTENNSIRVSEIGLSFIKDEPDISLALSIIRYLIYIAYDDGGLRKNKTNHISVSSSLAYKWLSEKEIPSLIHISIREQFYHLLSRFKLNVVIDQNQTKNPVPHCICKINATPMQFIKRQELITKNNKIFISLQAHAHLTMSAFENKLNFTEYLDQILEEYHKTKKKIFLCNTITFFGNNVISIGFIEKYQKAICFSRSSSGAFTLSYAKTSSSNTYLGNFISTLENLTHNTLVFPDQLQCHNIKSVSKTPFDGECQIAKVWIFHRDGYTYLSVNLADKSSKIERNIVLEKIDNMLLFDLEPIERLWAVLYPNLYKIKTEILLIYTDDDVLINKINLDIVYTSRNLYLTRLKTKFSSIAAITAFFDSIPKNKNFITRRELEIYNSDNFRIAYIKGIGKIIVSNHSLVRFIQRSAEAFNQTLSRPLNSLLKILTFREWQKLTDEEHTLYQIGKNKNNIFLKEERDGWIILLTPPVNDVSKLVTVVNINSPASKHMSNEDSYFDLFVNNEYSSEI